MSIVLKEIDIPKEGYIPMRIYANGHIWINGAYKGVAIQIPTPHGRLIDASTETTVESVTGTAMDVGMLLIALKQYVPTILGAEEE